MTFFNKKEDVMKIELTPYGRRLLSKGQFSPIYYSFLDDNILYNPECGGISETGLNAKNRILNETPYLKPQTNYKGVESSINSMASKLSDNFIDDNLIPERVEKLQYCLGKAPAKNNKVSEISAVFLKGEISSSTLIYSGSGVAPVDIPQLECVIENTLKVRYVPIILDVGLSSAKKPDGSFVEMTEDEIIVLLKDLEAFNTKDNFSVEIFEYTTNNDIDLKPIKIQKEKQRIVNDILIDETNEELMYENNIYHNDYFTIVFDHSINRGKICDGVFSLKQKNILVDLKVDCEDVQSTGFEVDLYRSSTTNNDLEDC